MKHKILLLCIALLLVLALTLPGCVQRGVPPGAKFTVDWEMSAIRDGRGHHVTVGSFSANVTGGGDGIVVDLNQPEVVISVPDGTSILPIRIDVQCQVPLIATDADESEIIIGFDKDAAWDTTGTSTEETTVNMRTTHGATSKCSCESAFTADISTSPALDYELARAVATADVQGSATNANWYELRCLYEPSVPIIADGPCMLLVYWGGTVQTTGFAQVEWLEFPTSYFA